MTPSEKIIKIRCELNVSQEALARELGVSFATINRWEKGIPCHLCDMSISLTVFVRRKILG